MLKEQDSHSLTDALVNVSGVRATKPQEALFAQPIVRGFPAEIYMNGLPAFGGTAASIDPTSLIGTERVEVLKGPDISALRRRNRRAARWLDQRDFQAP